MANLDLTRQWIENIYQLETTDPVMGGPDGVDNRQAKELGARTNWLKDQVDGINHDRTGYAPKSSPAFSGIPTAPTAKPKTSNTQIATTEFVTREIAALVGSAPATLDTLAEIATALGNDGNLKKVLVAEIAKKADAKHTHTMSEITDFELKNLSIEDLNSIKKTGFYSQVQNVNSTILRNYPEALAGSLVVRASTYGWQQEYTVYSNGHKYVRNTINSEADFGPWHRIDALDLTELLVGVPISYPLSTVPAGCLAMNGQRFDKNRYPKLGQKYPSGVLPDLRGEFIRGWDNGRGVDAGRALLSSQRDDFGSHYHGLMTGAGGGSSLLNLAVIVDGIALNSGVFSDSFKASNEYIKDGVPVRTYPSGGKETRPRNIAFQYICLAA